MLRASRGAIGVADDDLRACWAGTKAEIVVDVRNDGTKIGGEQQVRCPIRQRYTPAWWITDTCSFGGKYLSQ